MPMQRSGRQFCTVGGGCHGTKRESFFSNVFIISTLYFAYLLNYIKIFLSVLPNSLKNITWSIGAADGKFLKVDNFLLSLKYGIDIKYSCAIIHANTGRKVY